MLKLWSRSCGYLSGTIKIYSDFQKSCRMWKMTNSLNMGSQNMLTVTSICVISDKNISPYCYKEHNYIACCGCTKNSREKETCIMNASQLIIYFPLLNVLQNRWCSLNVMCWQVWGLLKQNRVTPIVFSLEDKGAGSRICSECPFLFWICHQGTNSWFSTK